MIVLDTEERVLLGRHRLGTLDLPGGFIEPGEEFGQAAVRELREETGLIADAGDVEVFAMLVDDAGVTRLTVAAIVRRYQGVAAVQPEEAHESWIWAKLSALPNGLFVTSGQVLRARWPHLPIDHPPVRLYRLQAAGRLRPAWPGA